MRDGLVSVKPAKAGAETNLNLITTSGQVYAFLLSEVLRDEGRRAGPDGDSSIAMTPTRRRRLRRLHLSYVPATQLDDFKAQCGTRA